MASSKRLFFLIPSAVKSGFVDSAVALFLFHAAPGKGRKRLLVFWPNLSVEHPHLSVEHPIFSMKKKVGTWVYIQTKISFLDMNLNGDAGVMPVKEGT